MAMRQTKRGLHELGRIIFIFCLFDHSIFSLIPFFEISCWLKHSELFPIGMLQQAPFANFSSPLQGLKIDILARG
jgi:hypothetical protein